MWRGGEKKKGGARQGAGGLPCQKVGMVEINEVINRTASVVIIIAQYGQRLLGDPGRHDRGGSVSSPAMERIRGFRAVQPVLSFLQNAARAVLVVGLMMEPWVAASVILVALAALATLAWTLVHGTDHDQALQHPESRPWHESLV